MHAFFEQEYQPRLSTEEADRARIYFPMLTSKSNLKPTGGRDVHKDLETAYPKVFAYIESCTTIQHRL